MNWKFLAGQIEKATRQPFKIVNTRSIGGGCINSAYQLQGEQISYFIKLNRRELLPMFEAEFAGLEEMSKSGVLRVPQPIICGVLEDQSYLVLEMIELKSVNNRSDRRLGEQLAKLHQEVKPFFGWHRDNTIGATVQINKSSSEWEAFWKEDRLGFQLSLAENNGFAGRLINSGEELCGGLDSFFEGYNPHPSLLHGDLWAGNAAVDVEGNPVVFDPACYYGDREADLAMTELFGGFSSDFYAAYNDIYPLDSGYSTRKILYNLYHILNHLNLFGGGYLGQAQNMIDRLLSEVR